MAKQERKVYYIGRRSSDICTDFNANIPDAFFEASITCFGDNQNGNIAHNVISGMQLRDDIEVYSKRKTGYIHTQFLKKSSHLTSMMTALN